MCSPLHPPHTPQSSRGHAAPGEGMGPKEEALALPLRHPKSQTYASVDPAGPLAQSVPPHWTGKLPEAQRRPHVCRPSPFSPLFSLPVTFLCNQSETLPAGARVQENLGENTIVFPNTLLFTPSHLHFSVKPNRATDPGQTPWDGRSTPFCISGAGSPD